eukprot:1624503-Rhodomonas_salina.1
MSNAAPGLLHPVLLSEKQHRSGTDMTRNQGNFFLLLLLCIIPTSPSVILTQQPFESTECFQTMHAIQTGRTAFFPGGIRGWRQRRREKDATRGGGLQLEGTD